MADGIRFKVPKVERRRHPRAITSFSATLLAAGRQWTTKVINLSLGGALLDLGKDAAQSPLAVHDRVSVTISQRGAIRPVTVTGRVVLWNKAIETQPLLAVQFDEVSDEDAGLIDDLMEEALNEIRGRAQRALL